MFHVPNKFDPLKKYRYSHGELRRLEAMATSVTGENLHEEDVNDSIPGATPFFKVELDEEAGEGYTPLKGLPSNPQDYLKSVMQEARHIPDVVVAKIDPNKIKGRKKPLVHSQYLSKPAPSDLGPSKDWQESQVADFAVARQEYVRHLAKLRSISRQTKKRPKLPIYPLPPWDDEENWRHLCFGASLKKRKNTSPEESPASVEQEDGEESDPTENVSDDDMNAQDALAAAGRTTVDILADQLQGADDDRIVDLATLEKGFPPMMRILLRMDANQVEANLEYHAKWLEEFGFSHDQGRWIYALLACLEKPLFPTVISCLRDLSRKCIELRSKLTSSDDTELNGLNLIICIVGRYFDQTDLADPW